MPNTSRNEPDTDSTPIEPATRQVTTYVTESLYKKIRARALKEYDGNVSAYLYAVIKDNISSRHHEYEELTSAIQLLLRRDSQRSAQVNGLYYLIGKFVLYWFAHTPELRDAEKGNVAARADERFNMFLKDVARYMSSSPELVASLLKASLFDEEAPNGPDSGNDEEALS